MSYTKGLRVSNNCPHTVLDFSGNMIAGFELPPNGDIPSRFQEAAANADLFVAAGPMLEALEGIVCGACQNRVGWTGDQLSAMLGGRDWRTCSSCKPARAAIALAKGEKP